MRSTFHHLTNRTNNRDHPLVESFYLFHRSMYYYTSEDPFTEATPVYGNITNGLGIFSGYAYRDYLFALQ